EADLHVPDARSVLAGEGLERIARAHQRPGPGLLGALPFDEQPPVEDLSVVHHGAVLEDRVVVDGAGRVLRAGVLDLAAGLLAVDGLGLLRDESHQRRASAACALPRAW